MIGLSRNMVNANNNLNEGEETRGLSKDKLYNRLAEEWLIPPIHSKGVSRAWLLQVWNGGVFRVGLRDYKTFEADLTPTHFKRNGFTNLIHLMLRINQLLESRQQLGLGFHQFCVPDEKWLGKVARYVDRGNVLEFFTNTVEPITGIRNIMPVVDKIHFCREYAHRQLLMQTGHMQKPGVFSAVLNVSEWHRKCLAKRIEEDETRLKHEEVVREVQTASATLRDSLIKAATSIYALENPLFRPDSLLNGGEGMNEEDRQRLRTIVDL